MISDNSTYPNAKLSVEEVKELAIGLVKQRRVPSDITLLVCDALGCDWETGEEFVTLIAGEQQEELDQQAQMFSIPLGIMFMIIGFMILMGIWLSASLLFSFNGSLLSIYLQWTMKQGIMSPIVLLEIGIIFSTGVGLILGGIAGLVQALWKVWAAKQS